jgi:ankyrin repeat protein
MTTDSEVNDVIAAIRAGELATLQRLLASNPILASSRLGGSAKGRTPLHVVADWPGYFPNGPKVVWMLIEAGADPNARDSDHPNSETPLHWAASSDDVDVACALIDGGADVEVPDGSIGTPLDNAIGYSCWHVARLLVQRSARVDKLWHAAALGMIDRLEELLGGQSGTELNALSQAFWHACAAGQRRTAELLRNRGADLDWIPKYAKGTPLDAAGNLGTRQENVIIWLRDQGAHSSDQLQ